METTKTVYVPGVGQVEVSVSRPLAPHLRPLLSKLDERQRFWLNLEQKWPRDALGKTFLARAALSLGAAMFPDDWTGHEPGADTYIQALPMFSSQARPVDQLIAIRALPLPEPSPQDDGQESVSVIQKLMSRQPVDHTRWRMAVDLRRLTLAALDPSRQRWATVQARLVEALLNGEVRYFLRVDSTGEFGEALPGHWWNTEATGTRLYYCKMHPREPISSAVAGDGFRWIFVEQENLAALIARINAQNGPTTSLRRRREFEEILVQEMKASTRNPYTREYWQNMGRSEYGIAIETFDTIWKAALTRVPGAKWNAPGRPARSPDETPK